MSVHAFNVSELQPSTTHFENVLHLNAFRLSATQGGDLLMHFNAPSQGAVARRIQQFKSLNFIASMKIYVFPFLSLKFTEPCNLFCDLAGEALGIFLIWFTWCIWQSAWQLWAFFFSLINEKRNHNGIALNIFLEFSYINLLY